MSVLVVGAGEIAEEHLKALLAAGVAPGEIVVAGRGRPRAELLGEEYGVEWRSGGLHAVEGTGSFEHAIVAVSPEALAGSCRALLDAGCRSILLEKPGALSSSELAKLSRDGSRVSIAYNRRFLPSVAAVRTAIEEDGGPIACSFEFTEMEGYIRPAAEAKGFGEDVLARWGVANSLHVIDLFLHLTGLPEEHSYGRRGELDWHPSGSVFFGSGVTDRGAAFGYVSPWGGAGRWWLEVTTASRRLILRPLETAFEQAAGGFAVESLELAAEAPGLKPGFEGQLRAFLDGGAGTPLVSLEEAVEHTRVAEEILGYTS